jgi:dTDP-4-amino-4,6-dideoxygalactose transaminase
MSKAPVMVTHAALPPLAEYVSYLTRIWDSHWLTNNGPLVRELEHKLRDYLECPQLWFVNNGTTALQLAIKALGLTGEIITTPFSYVATTGTILWENCTPVFVDVRERDLTIDPQLVEAKITSRTQAILATHVYGFPCDVDALGRIARRHNLKIIYDAAHAFGCRLHGRSLASFGDVSCLSFHATKLFHTVEGGAVVINSDAALTERVRLMRAFGHHGDHHQCIGINGKNSEFHAAMGLCNLPLLPTTLARRREQHRLYDEKLCGSRVSPLTVQMAGFEYNHAYYPVLLPSEAHLLESMVQLAADGIVPRRYFYPALNRLPYVDAARCAVAEDAAARVLCLPLSEVVTAETIERVSAGLLRVCR